MADPTIFAPAPIQLPAIPTKKKVIVVRRTTRNPDSSSGVPTLPPIRQSRESFSNTLSESRGTIFDSSGQSYQVAQSQVEVPGQNFGTDQLVNSSDNAREPDANPDEFGALILASATPSQGAFCPTTEEGETEAATTSEGEYPVDIEAAINSAEDGGLAIKEAYERRKKHRLELAMQARLLQQHQQDNQDEKHLLPCQQIEAGAEARAFENWKRKQEDWENVKRSVMAKTGKPETELVMERGPEFRALKEAKDHLDAAKPLEAKFSGPAMWEMSLRNHWTRSYPVGSIFSRVFQPPMPTGPRELERIGRPEAALNGTTTQSVSSEAEATGTERNGTSRELDDGSARGFGTEESGSGTGRNGTGTHSRGRSWLDSEFVKERQRKLRKQMQSLLPHEPEINGLQVVGYSIEAGLAAAASAPITLEEVERELEASNNHAYTQLLEERAAAQSATRALAEEPPTAEARATQKGPALSLAAGRMTLCARGAGALATEGLEVSNRGSTVLFYQWERDEESASELRFYQMDMAGVLQPGECRVFEFSFKSREPGTWLESWRLVTEPKVEPPIEALILKGIALDVEDSSTDDARAEVEAELATRVRTRAVEEALAALLDDVRTPKRGLQEENDDDIAAELGFVRRNLESEEVVYYRPEEHMRSLAIADAVSAMEERASKDGEALTSKVRWDGSVKELTERIETLAGADGLKERLREVTENLKLPLSRRALLRRVMLLTLRHVADGVFEGVESARASERAAELAGTSEGNEEGVEPDEEAIAAQREERERATKEEILRKSLENASTAFDGLEGHIGRSEERVCEILDRKVSEVIEGSRGLSEEAKAASEWEVFALQRQKQSLILSQC